MKTNYQIIFIGGINKFQGEIQKSLKKHIVELGVDYDTIKYIDNKNFNKEYIGSSPTICLYFENKTENYEDLDIVEILLKDATLIIPVVENLEEFNVFIPLILRNINGYALKSVLDIESVVNCILEGLGLLRISRRLFISYKRNESTSVAIQLYEQFEKKGFDVFLDTHSIRPGEPFQEELWHRMTDTDIIVFLNTPKFMESHWCEKEIAEANVKSIGILQLVWPNHVLENNAQICIPLKLSELDFVDGIYSKYNKSFLQQSTIDKIVSETESLRARTLASRQDNLISEFISTANRLGLNVNLQPERIIVENRVNGKERIFIPTVGIPQSLTYNQSEELVSRIKRQNVEDIFLLFDHRSIRDKWLNHLFWLDKHLPIKTTKIVGIEKWLRENN